LLTGYTNLIEYGLHKTTGRVRRRKANALLPIPLEEVLSGLKNWAGQLKQARTVAPVLQETSAFIKKLPPVLEEEQQPERFTLHPDDIGLRRAAKQSKIAIYTLQGRIYAVFSGAELPAWKQRIPLRALVEANQAELFGRLLPAQKHHIEICSAITEACQKYFDSFIRDTASSLKTTEPGREQALEVFYDALQQLKARIARHQKAEASQLRNAIQLQLRQLYRHIAQVDTIELSSRHFSRSAIEAKQKQLRREYELYGDVLARDIALCADEMQLKESLLRLSQTALEQMENVRSQLYELFKGKEGFAGVIGPAQQSYEENARRYAIPPEARRSDARLITHITNLREVFQRMLMPVPEGEIQPDEHADLSAETLLALPAYAEQIRRITPEESLIEEFGSAVLYKGNELPPRLSYHEQRKIDKQTGRPSVDAAHISLREEVTAYLRGVLLRKIAPLPAQINDECSKLQENWLEMSEAISINLGSAIDVAEDREEEKYRIKASELAGEALRRGEERLQEFSAAAEASYTKIQQTFDAAAGESLLFLLDVALEGSYSQLKWKSRSLKVEETALGWKSKLIMYWSRFRDTAAVFQRFSGQKYRSSSSWFRRSVGIGTTGDEASIKTDAAQFLAETDRIIAQLPLIYRRLYRNEPVEHKRFLIGRSSHLATLRRAYDDWEARYYSNFIAIGERGSGKTSILEIGIQQLGLPETRPVIRGRLHHTIYTEAELLTHLCDLFDYAPSSRAELLARLRARKDRPVVVWEGFQNLYLRHIGGFEALETFLLIISQTGQHVFWAVSCSRYAWSYLDKIFRVGEYFIHSCFTDEFTAAEIRDVIMSRHPISGYELEFMAGEREQASRMYKKMLNDFSGRQEYLAERYFTELFQVSEGNISIALLYWLRSVQIEDGETIKIAPLTSTLRQIGDGLSEDAVFVLAFILLHDDLTPPQLALAFHISEQESQLLLSRLAAKSLLSLGEDGRYYLNHMLYRHITRILKTKNILH
ncbi:MAG: ATP-binding protein, partial [Cyclonatronaceae bacterium]